MYCSANVMQFYGVVVLWCCSIIKCSAMVLQYCSVMVMMLQCYGDAVLCYGAAEMYYCSAIVLLFYNILCYE